MIRLTRAFAATLIGLCCTAGAHADTFQKIGFINTERIYLESKQARNIQKRWTANFPPVRTNCKTATRRLGFGKAARRRQT
ncbi:Outer membrane protein OmpH, putative [Neisseria gonorrhoeae]|uniref:Outer membrane protein OmpH, putative n=1 Tax=Neisseria gonorrhoeae TaxID=485 RepID=A0A379B1M8_NEIGO|nr:Outer membrane protein OmpH, putative [Neisseria gonorrhoeae]